MPNIRDAYNQIGKSLTPLDTVLSFADNGDGRTLVTVLSGGLTFFSDTYIIFDSYTYGDVYLAEEATATTFIIDTPFVLNDAGVALYNVTEVYNSFVAATAYLSNLACIDALGPTYNQIIYYYALHLYTQAQGGGRSIKSREIEGMSKTEYFDINKQAGTNSNYFAMADDLSGGCLTASLSKSIMPSLGSAKTWC